MMNYEKAFLEGYKDAYLEILLTRNMKQEREEAQRTANKINSMQQLGFNRMYKNSRAELANQVGEMNQQNRALNNKNNRNAVLSTGGAVTSVGLILKYKKQLRYLQAQPQTPENLQAIKNLKRKIALVGGAGIANVGIAAGNINSKIERNRSANIVRNAANNYIYKP